MSEFEDFTKTLEALGKDKVRHMLSQGVWASRRKNWAQEWLDDLDYERENRRAEKHLALSEEANEIARSALKISRSAKIISIAAIVISTITSIIVAAIQFLGQKPS